jgi:hypothetical protein
MLVFTVKMTQDTSYIKQMPRIRMHLFVLHTPLILGLSQYALLDAVTTFPSISSLSAAIPSIPNSGYFPCSSF